MKQKLGHRVTSLVLILLLGSCRSQERQKIAGVGYSKEYNGRMNDLHLLLGCIVYARESAGPISADSIGDFYRITTTFRDALRSGKNMDKLVDDFTDKHKNVDFKSLKAMRRIESFVACYNIISDSVFGKISADDQKSEIDSLEGKIVKVPEMLKIYRMYIPPGNDLSSLSSSGVALNIQMAYYLSTLDVNRRNEILKALL